MVGSQCYQATSKSGNSLLRQSAGQLHCRRTIPLGSPWENPFAESFNGRFRDEFLNIELFSSLPEAKVLAEQHRIEYNVYRPHLALQQWKAA